MLDREVTTLLRNNPEAFSKLLQRLLGESTPSEAAATFKGKRTRIPRGKVSAKTRNEPDDPPALPSPPLRLPETGDDIWDGLLVDDVKNKLFSALYKESLKDEHVFLDLFLLALVSKGLHKSLRPLVQQLETRINVVPLYCRALFEYIRDPPTFRLFLNRLEKAAPAVHMAWKVLLHHNKLIKFELGGIITALTTEARMHHFHAALANDGCDPIATALCMHHLAQPAEGFSEENLATLTGLTLDKTWAMFMMPLDTLTTMEIPTLFDMRHVLHACTTRYELFATIDVEDQFMAILSRLGQAIEDEDLQLHMWSKRRDDMAKRLAKIAPDLPLKVVIFTAELRQRWTLRAFEQDLLYEWMKHALHLIDLTSEGAIATILETLAHGVTFLRARAQDPDAATQAFLGVVARYLGHPRVPANVTVAVFFQLDYPHWISSIAELLLVNAIELGHHELVRAWIQGIGVNLGGHGSLSPLKAGQLMRLASSIDVVAKRDPVGEIQDLVCDYIMENVPGAFDLRDWKVGEGVCIGDRFMDLITRMELEQRSMRIFRQGRLLFRALSQRRANAELLGIVGLVEGAHEDAYYTAAYIASKLAPWKPSFARFILEKVFDYLGGLLETNANSDAYDLFLELCELSAESTYYFVYSKVFEQFFKSPAFKERSTVKLTSHLGKQLRLANSLTVTRHAVSKMPPGLGAEILSWMITPSIYDKPDSPIFVSWNISLRFIRRPEYAYLSTFDMDNIAQMEQIRMRYESDEDRAILKFYNNSSIHSLSILEKLYVLARPYLQ